MGGVRYCKYIFCGFLLQLLCGELLCALDDIRNQEGTGQWAHTTWVRGDESGLFPHVRVYVAGKFAIDTRDSHVQDSCAFFDHVGGEHVWLACCSDDDVSS